MKFIVKNSEPEAWRQYRQTPGVQFTAIPELKKALLEEQGYICCYCMSQIKESNMAVEHYKPRRYEDLIFDYSNLFASCKGNFCSDRHCDNLKDDTEIKICLTNPAINCEHIVGYSSSGKLIYPEDYKIDIEKTLNLNNTILVANRKKVILGAAQALKKKGFNRATIQSELRKYTEKGTDGKFKPYCLAAQWILRKKLSAN